MKSFTICSLLIASIASHSLAFAVSPAEGDIKARIEALAQDINREESKVTATQQQVKGLIKSVRKAKTIRNGGLMLTATAAAGGILLAVILKKTGAYSISDTLVTEAGYAVMTPFMPFMKATWSKALLEGNTAADIGEFFVGASFTTGLATAIISEGFATHFLTQLTAMESELNQQELQLEKKKDRLTRLKSKEIELSDGG